MQNSRRGSRGTRKDKQTTSSGKGKRGSSWLERKHRYKNHGKGRQSERRKPSYQHGSIVFGIITLQPHPALQLAERGKKRFFPLADISVENCREGEVVRARLLSKEEGAAKGVAKGAAKGLGSHQSTRQSIQQGVQQDLRQDVQQGVHKDVRQSIQQGVHKDVRQGGQQGVQQESSQDAGRAVTYNSAKYKFRTRARILFAQPLESLGCFDGDVAFLCELGLRQHATNSSAHSNASQFGEAEDQQLLEAEVESIVPYLYPQKKKPETQKSAQSLRENSREDLRDLPFITIDGEDARDFDDAVMAEAVEKNFLLRIAIADVALYVTEGSLLDKRARARGNSVYLPDRVVAMLPAKLSETLCSLQPQRERPCLMVEILIDASGCVLKQRIARVMIKSKARVTYTQVADILAKKKRETELEKLVGNLYSPWQALARARAERGALEIDRAEPVPIIEKTDSGRINCTSIVERHNNNARRIIEDFMIAANVAVAKHLNKSQLNKSQSSREPRQTKQKQAKQEQAKQEQAKDLGFVVRNHEPPTPDKWQALQEDLGRLMEGSYSQVSDSLQLGKSGSQKKHARVESASQSDRQAELKRRQLRALLQAVQEKSSKEKSSKEKSSKEKSAKANDQASSDYLAGSDYLPLLVAEAVLRAQSQARYATVNPQHFALGLPNYCHFTSPIRRYADLLVHRAVLATLENNSEEEGEKGADKASSAKISPAKITPELCQHLIDCERSAIALERITFQRIACLYLKKHLGEVLEGVVVKVMPFGFFVRLRNLPVEGIVAREKLPQYHFQYANETALVGKQSIGFGSKVKVEIYESDPIAPRLELRLQE